MVRGSWRPNRTATFWPPLLWPSALCLSCSPGLLNRWPGGSLFAGFLYYILSATRDPNSIGGLESPFGLVWLSLSHLVSTRTDSNFLSWLSSTSCLDWVQRPLNRPLNLWNGMFDRHQAEITVMQFTGHYLPVHQSMSVSWDFFLVPFHQPNPAYAISFDYWPLGCVTSFRCITLEWHIAQVEGQNTTLNITQTLKFGYEQFHIYIYIYIYI